MPNGIPVAPAYRAPGGIATDIAGGLASFAQSLQSERERAAVEAFRQAQMKLQRDKMAQDTSEGALDRELKKHLGELQAQVERERNERIRQDQERDRSSAIETSTRDIRGEFQHQLGERGKQKVADAYRRMVELNSVPKAQRTPEQVTELERLTQTVGLGQQGISPRATHADSLAAFDAAAGTATGPLSSEAATRLRAALHLDQSAHAAPSPELQSRVQADAKEAFASGMGYGRLVAKVREKIASGELPAEAEGWVVESIRSEQGRRASSTQAAPPIVAPAPPSPR